MLEASRLAIQIYILHAHASINSQGTVSLIALKPAARFRLNHSSKRIVGTELPSALTAVSTP